MRTAFTIERLIYDMLVEAQADGQTKYLFDMDPDVALYNYNPGDARVLGFAPSGEGLYIFFDDNDLDTATRDPEAQNIKPQLKAYLYIASEADANGTSIDIAHARAKAVIASFYGCLMHTTFKRKLTENLQAVPGYESKRVNTVTIRQVKNVATYPIERNSTASVVFWEILSYYACTEEPGQDPGRPLLGIEDRLVVVRKEEDLPE
jgi:hypothetical protein